MAWDDKETKVWMDGEFVEWKDANISVLSHVVHYGTSVFEGIRAYENENGVFIQGIGWTSKRDFGYYLNSEGNMFLESFNPDNLNEISGSNKED